MKRIGNIAALAAAALLLAGCGASTPAWGDYSPGLHDRIDGMMDADDCAGLQGEYDDADGYHDDMMSRHGHNNDAVMDYIRDAMREANCT